MLSTIFIDKLFNELGVLPFNGLDNKFDISVSVIPKSIFSSQDLLFNQIDNNVFSALIKE
ncbi:hypothetical protein OUHCRE21_46390 [Enterobacter hormaechei subsp. xiangfangensis]